MILTRLLEHEQLGNDNAIPELIGLIKTALKEGFLSQEEFNEINDDFELDSKQESQVPPVFAYTDRESLRKELMQSLQKKDKMLILAIANAGLSVQYITQEEHEQIMTKLNIE